MCLGDIADGGHQSEYESYEEFARKISSEAELKTGGKFLVYGIPGNHDTYHGGLSVYGDYVFPYATYFRFSAGGFSFYALDTANGTLGKHQFDDLSSRMRNDTNPKIVLTHYPIYAGGNFLMTMQNTVGRNRILALFQKYGVRQVFGGHAHREFGFDYGSFREDILASYLYSNVYYLVTVNGSAVGVEKRVF